MVLKPTNKYKIIQQWHNFESILNNFLHHQTLYCKGFLNIIFYGAENKKNGQARQLTIQAFIYYLIHSGVRKAFCNFMEDKEA